MHVQCIINYLINSSHGYGRTLSYTTMYRYFYLHSVFPPLDKCLLNLVWLASKVNYDNLVCI